MDQSPPSSSSPPPSPLTNLGGSVSNPVPPRSGSLSHGHKPSYITSQVPFTSPLTPSPSPSPQFSITPCTDGSELALFRDIRPDFASLSVPAKNAFLAQLVSICPVETLVHVYNIITPRIKRDFLRDLPPELALHIVSLIDDARTLTRASAVSKYWRALLSDEFLWKNMCKKHKYCSDRISRADDDGICRSPRARVVRRLSMAHSEPEEQAREAALASLSLSDSETVSTEDLDLDYTDERAVLEAEAMEQAGVFTPLPHRSRQGRTSEMPHDTRALGSSLPPRLAAHSDLTLQKRPKRDNIAPEIPPFSYKRHFKISALTEFNWRHAGRVVHSHTLSGGTVTNVAMDSEWIIVSLTNCKVYVFSARTGAHVRSLVGHSLGIWALHLVSRGGRPEKPPCPEKCDTDAADYHMSDEVESSGGSGYATCYATPQPQSSPLAGQMNEVGIGFGNSLHPSVNQQPYSHISPPVSPDLHARAQNPLNVSASSRRTDSLPSSRGKKAERPNIPPLPKGLYSKQSDVCNASYGWGQEGAYALSGSCDRELRVWDVRSGFCLHILRGHTSTIRCVKALDGRPVALSSARDGVVRVWDIQKGICLRVLEGHRMSVRSLAVAGNVCVTASYDTTARMWNVDTGECLRVLRGHQQQLYSVTFDGVHVATGSLDSTVRLWDAETGECLTLLQGHTSLVGNVQLIDDDLVTGASDGRVIVFSLKTYTIRLRICAHDNSVTTLQVDSHYLVTGGNDGCVKLYDRSTGELVRELTERCEGVWKVLMRRDKCVIMCRRGGNTVVEVLGFAPTAEQL